MAIFHGKLIDAFFIRPFYKMLLKHPILLRFEPRLMVVVGVPEVQLAYLDHLFLT